MFFERKQATKKTKFYFEISANIKFSDQVKQHKRCARKTKTKLPSIHQEIQNKLYTGFFMYIKKILETQNFKTVKHF